MGSPTQHSNDVINQHIMSIAEATKTKTWKQIVTIVNSELGTELSWRGCQERYKRYVVKTGKPMYDRRKGMDGVVISRSRPQQDKPSDYEERLIEVFHENKRPVEETDWKDCLGGFAEAKSHRDKFAIEYRKVVCRIKTNKPVAFACISDVHIGSPHTDYEAFGADMGRIIDDKRFYLMKGGDWADKMSNFRDKQAAVGQLHPETIQLVTVERIMDAMKGRIVAAIGGNHDTMDARKSGVSSEYWIHRNKPFPYMPTGGLVELIVGKQTYRIVWTHTYGIGHSRINKHNVFNWLRRELSATADIYILEHHHDPSMQEHELDEFEKQKVLEIRTGTYKITDPYAQQFYKEGRRGPQPFVLFPDKKKVVAIHGEDGIENMQTYLNGLT